MRDTTRMNEQYDAPNYQDHRVPPEIIAHAVWLYFRFALRYREVEELLAERSVILTYKTVRQWCRKFGQAYANELRRRRPGWAYPRYPGPEPAESSGGREILP